MNIPPDNQPNDLNRGAAGEGANPIINAIYSFATQVYEANREWTDVKDFAFRFAVPLFGIAATALCKQYLDNSEKRLAEGHSHLQIAQAKLVEERQAFEEERGVALNRPLAKVVDELMANANTKSYKALQEIEDLQPMIKSILKVRCSSVTSKEQRVPLEKEMRARILRQPSPFDSYGTLKANILEDTLEIVKKDISHCDFPWPVGNHNNGELYKVYKENWRLTVELEKHKHILQQLKHPASRVQE